MRDAEDSAWPEDIIIIDRLFLRDRFFVWNRESLRGISVEELAPFGECAPSVELLIPDGKIGGTPWGEGNPRIHHPEGAV